jgi:ubiquitin carboxyl-terminal hydrolase 5/13
MVNLFRYQVEERIQCTVSGMVRYNVKPEVLLTLPVPMATATNQEEVAVWKEKESQLKAEKKPINPEDVVRAKVSYTSCLTGYSSPTNIDDFYSTALKTKSTATRMYRFKTFPGYLIIQLAKFAFDDNWVPAKFDVEVNMPEVLDLTHLRAQGIQPGEQELPQEDTSQSSGVVQIDEAIVSQLADMGFDVEGCKRAVYNTNNQGVEAAMNWVLEHMGDSDFAAPFVLPGSNSSQPQTSSISEDAIAMISSLGFTREQALKALKSTDGNVERAADWVFSHLDELQEVEEGDANPEMEQEEFTDGVGKYQLIAFISHMGTSAMTGHYVCHVWKDGRWVIFNDNKVAESITPPKDLAYMYFYRRLNQ